MKRFLENVALVMLISMFCAVGAYAQPAPQTRQQVDLNEAKNHNTPWSCSVVNVTILPFVHSTVLSKSISDLNKLTQMDVTLGLVSTQRTWTVDDCSIEVGYINTSLYIASELSASSSELAKCAFDHVMEHEQEHLAIYRRHLATLKERAELRLPQARTLGELHKALDFLTLSTRPDHAQLDSPEEYAKNSHVCHGKLKKIMMNYINGR